MRAHVLLSFVAALAVPSVALAGGCPTCTTDAECVPSGGGEGFCVEWSRDFGCGSQRVACCPGQGCDTFSGRPSCEGADADGDMIDDCHVLGAAVDAGTPGVDAGTPSTEVTLAECTDGVDNDGNGFIDCADFSCQRSTDPEVLARCAMDAGGADAGGGGVDAGAGSMTDGGCGCRAGGPTSRGTGVEALGLLALLFSARAGRRRRAGRTDPRPR
ncbi:MAG: hypothetical protein H6719_07060 [Sandaracinaceae bacterium]|nr:hypothetical protein [Sandaracinaceae bacterium]